MSTEVPILRLGAGTSRTADRLCLRIQGLLDAGQADEAAALVAAVVGEAKASHCHGFDWISKTAQGYHAQHAGVAL